MTRRRKTPNLAKVEARIEREERVVGPMNGTRHTNEEWQLLMAELTKIISNENETLARRRKAQDILDSIMRPGVPAYSIYGKGGAGSQGAQRDKRGYNAASQIEYDGKIV